MKHNLTLLSAAMTFAAHTAQGQILTVLDVLPLAGDSFRYHGVLDAESFEAGPSGFGATWDHSDLQIVSENYSQLTWVEPTAAPHIADHPGSDLVLNRTISLDPAYFNYMYYDRREEGIFQVGAVGEVLSYAYDVQELVNAIPLFAGTPVVRDFCYYSTGLGQTYHFCGESHEELDGQGTLILPYGTFPDVIRSTSQLYQVEDAAPSDTSSTLYHRWWVPGLRRPILEESRFTGSTGNTFVSITVMNAGFVLGQKELPSMSARIYPIPFADRLTIELAAPLHQLGMLEIFTPDGRQVHRATMPAGNGQWHVDAASLPAGPLLVALTTEGTRSVHSAIHQR